MRGYLSALLLGARASDMWSLAGREAKPQWLADLNHRGQLPWTSKLSTVLRPSLIYPSLPDLSMASHLHKQRQTAANCDKSMQILKNYTHISLENVQFWSKCKQFYALNETAEQRVVMEHQSPLKERLSKLIGARRGKLSQLSAMMNTIGSFKLDTQMWIMWRRCFIRHFSKCSKSLRTLIEVLAFLDERE